MTDTNYVVEDKFDFWEELNKQDDFVLDDTHCLLSKETLCQNHIVLPCGHKFNYAPLCKEIANLKYPSKTYARQITLNKHQICCPYCRKVFDKLLPKIPLYNLGMPNHICSDINSIQLKQCSWIMCENTNAFESCYGVLCTKHYNKSFKKPISIIKDDAFAKIFKENTVTKLRERLFELNLSTKGLKSVLVDRLVKHEKI